MPNVARQRAIEKALTLEKIKKSAPKSAPARQKQILSAQTRKLDAQRATRARNSAMQNAHAKT
jgi:hypothetical protein